MRELKNGVEENKNSEGAYKSYQLGKKGITELNVELDSTGEFDEYFKKTFPGELKIVKQLSEQ